MTKIVVIFRVCVGVPVRGQNAISPQVALYVPCINRRLFNLTRIGADVTYSSMEAQED